MEAVKQDGLALSYVINQTPEICLAAVRQDENAFRLIRDAAMRNAVKSALG